MPIIRSLLDLDWYKLTMGQFVFARYRDVPVTYAFTNRTARVRLAECIDEATLRRELDHARTLRLTPGELAYLRSFKTGDGPLFSEDYLRFLEELALPAYRLERTGGTYRLEFPGAWSKAIYWETIALAIVNELYYRAILDRLSPRRQEMICFAGKVRLAEKIEALSGRPDITFCDFGTRRRFSRAWQGYVDQVLSQTMPGQFLGTSCVESAMTLGLTPMGTMAHELFMVMAGIMHGSDACVRTSHNRMLQEWWEAYGGDYSVALTDAYGTDFFFQDMTAGQARAWKGLRQDSGDPLIFGERAIAFYHALGIDPREKLLVFSDGLDLAAILKIADRFAGRIRVTFGWGTNLTNDLGPEPLSLVVKVVEAWGNPTVKLSDNLAKATGDPEQIERFKRIFGYRGGMFAECRY